MKSLFKFLFGQKNEYIGLSSFKEPEVKAPVKKEPKPTVNKTALTGLIRRIN